MMNSATRNHLEPCDIAPKAFKDWFRGLVAGLAGSQPSADQWTMIQAKVDALNVGGPLAVPSAADWQTRAQDVWRDSDRVRFGVGSGTWTFGDPPVSQHGFSRAGQPLGGQTHTIRQEDQSR